MSLNQASLTPKYVLFFSFRPALTILTSAADKGEQLEKGLPTVKAVGDLQVSEHEAWAFTKEGMVKRLVPNLEPVDVQRKTQQKQFFRRLSRSMTSTPLCLWRC